MNEIPAKFLQQEEELARKRDAIVLPKGEHELARLLYEADKEKKQLRVKLGIDPTSTDLHLGHTVCLELLKKFLDYGHKPILIIGGFTACVGDPSGRNETRPPLTYKEVEDNAKTYLSQVKKILYVEKIEVVNNYEWLNKLSSQDLVKLAHLVTVNQLVAKEAFGERMEKGYPLYLHEVLYPILQGYDSVVVKADIEIGGVDQTFNVLFGRQIQKFYKQKEQLVMLLPLLVGLDGAKKMSKTFNNHISLNDEANDIYGKTMSIPDELVIHYFKLVTDVSLNEIENFEKELKGGKNPRDVKMILAHEIVTMLHGKEEANKAEDVFVKQFRLHEIPPDIEEFVLNEPIKIVDLMFLAKLVPSKAEAKRLIQGGGVKLKSNKVGDPNFVITLKDKNSVLQIGRRKFIRII